MQTLIKQLEHAYKHKLLLMCTHIDYGITIALNPHTTSDTTISKLTAHIHTHADVICTVHKSLQEDVVYITIEQMFSVL